MENIKYIIWIILIMSFASYVIAMVKVRKHTIVAIANWYDFTLLIITFIALVLTFLNLKNGQPNLPMTFLIISVLSFCGSIIYSIIANYGNVLKIFISIFAKIFLLLVLIFSVFYLFRASKSEISDDDYQSLKNDLKTVLTIGIAGFLIFNLINHKRPDIMTNEIGRKQHTR